MGSLELNLDSMLAHLPIQRVVNGCKMYQETDSYSQVLELSEVNWVEPIILQCRDETVLSEDLTQLLGIKGPYASTQVIILPLSPCDKDWVFRVMHVFWIWKNLDSLLTDLSLKMANQSVKAIGS